VYRAQCGARYTHTHDLRKTVKIDMSIGAILCSLLSQQNTLIVHFSREIQACLQLSQFILGLSTLRNP